jgi:hypothetical protein
VRHVVQRVSDGACERDGDLQCRDVRVYVQWGIQAVQWGVHRAGELLHCKRLCGARERKRDVHGGDLRIRVQWWVSFVWQ